LLIAGFFCERWAPTISIESTSTASCPLYA
jgi:hypothetical protein